ncbi:MAG: ABC transporter ATP-binding protein [bacterium]
MAVIEIDHLTKIYKKSHLGKTTSTVGVEDLTLHIEKGEIFGLLGLNGSGKTTTIKLLLGLLFPTAGTISIGGIRIPHINARKMIGYLPEVAFLYKFLNANEILRYYAVLSGIPKDTIQENITRVLEKVHMTLHASRRLSEYSKGMQQRIALAQSIIHDPSVLLFDEPVTGIDPIGLKDMRQLILDLNQAGKTILFSSHSISEVEKISHRVGVLVKGKLARIIAHEEWAGKEGYLEKIFIDTVKPSLAESGGIS